MNELTRADKNLLVDVVRNSYPTARNYFFSTLSDRPTLRPRRHNFTLPTKDDSNYIPESFADTVVQLLNF